MIEAKELVENVDTYIRALCYSCHCDEQELFAAVAEHTQRVANELAQ